MAGAESAPAGRSGPSIRRFVPVGALVHAAHRLHLPVPVAVRLRLQHLVEPALHLRLQSKLPGWRQREHAPRRRRRCRRVPTHAGAGRHLARSLCRRSRPFRSSSNRASPAGRNGRFRGRRISAANSHTCRRRRPRAAVRRRPAPASRAHRCRRRRSAPAPPTRRRPRAIRRGRSIPPRRVRRSPAEAPAATRPSHHPVADRRSSCPMAMAPARSYIRMAG